LNAAARVSATRLRRIRAMADPMTRDDEETLEPRQGQGG
jgi:hypothetical protein